MFHSLTLPPIFTLILTLTLTLTDTFPAQFYPTVIKRYWPQGVRAHGAASHSLPQSSILAITVHSRNALFWSVDR